MKKIRVTDCSLARDPHDFSPFFVTNRRVARRIVIECHYIDSFVEFIGGRRRNIPRWFFESARLNDSKWRTIWRAIRNERRWLPVVGRCCCSGQDGIAFMREARNRIHNSPHLSDGSIKPAGEHRGKRPPAAAIWRHKDSSAHTLARSLARRIKSSRLAFSFSKFRSWGEPRGLKSGVSAPRPLALGILTRARRKRAYVALPAMLRGHRCAPPLFPGSD